MRRCPKCNSLRTFELPKAGKCKDCGHWYGENMCIAMDIDYMFSQIFEEENER